MEKWGKGGSWAGDDSAMHLSLEAPDTALSCTTSIRRAHGAPRSRGSVQMLQQRRNKPALADSRLRPATACLAAALPY